MTQTLRGPLVVRVRQAGPADAAAIDALIATTADERLGSTLSEYEVDDCVRSYQEQRISRTCHVAESGSRLLGYAVVRTGLADLPALGRLERLYVSADVGDHDAQRAVAEGLVGAIEADAARRNTATDALDVFDRWGFVDMHAMTLCLNSHGADGRCYATVG